MQEEKYLGGTLKELTKVTHVTHYIFIQEKQLPGGEADLYHSKGGKASRNR